MDDHFQRNENFEYIDDERNEFIAYTERNGRVVFWKAKKEDLVTWLKAFTVLKGPEAENKEFWFSYLDIITEERTEKVHKRAKDVYNVENYNNDLAGV